MVLDLKPLVTPKDAAIYLWGSWDPTTRKRIYRWVESGKINSIRDGRRYWIPREQLTRFDETGAPVNDADEPADVDNAIFKIGNG